MDKKKTLATLAFLLTTGQAASSQEVDLRTLKLLEENGISFEEFQSQFDATPNATKAGGNYSRFSISSGNYSRFSISSSNYSRFSISSGNYSRFSISSSNYSRFSISGFIPASNEAAGEIPVPMSDDDDTEVF